MSILKIIRKWIFDKIILPNMSVESTKAIGNLSGDAYLTFYLSIFGERVAKIELSQEDMVRIKNIP
jgi:hypothetical protein